MITRITWSREHEFTTWMERSIIYSLTPTSSWSDCCFPVELSTGLKTCPRTATVTPPLHPLPYYPLEIRQLMWVPCIRSKLHGVVIKGPFALPPLNRVELKCRFAVLSIPWFNYLLTCNLIYLLTTAPITAWQHYTKNPIDWRLLGSERCGPENSRLNFVSNPLAGNDTVPISTWRGRCRLCAVPSEL